MPDLFSFVSVIAKPVLFLLNRIFRNNSRNRDEDRELIKDIQSKLSELTALGTKYWNMDYSSHSSYSQLHDEIILKCTELSKLINRLRIHGINCENQFNRYKHHLTGGTFESRTKKINLDMANNGIPKYAAALDSAIEQAYVNIYRK